MPKSITAIFTERRERLRKPISRRKRRRW